MRRTALDRRNYLALVDTTVELALKVGASDIISKIVEDLKDESEPFRRMVMECVTKVVEHLGRFRYRPKIGRVIGRWRSVFIPRANARRERYHVERFRYGRQRSRSKS